MIRIAILTISDRSARGERADASGPALQDQIIPLGWTLVQTSIIPDDFAQIAAVLTRWCDEGAIDVILTTGGTGFAPRDITPEATKSILERETPGLAEAMRLESLKITPHAMLSRACCGIRKRTLIINLPGSPKAAVENLHFILPVLPHAVDLLREDRNAETSHGRLNY